MSMIKFGSKEFQRGQEEDLLNINQDEASPEMLVAEEKIKEEIRKQESQQFWSIAKNDLKEWAKSNLPFYEINENDIIESINNGMGNENGPDEDLTESDIIKNSRTCLESIAYLKKAKELYSSFFEEVSKGLGSNRNNLMTYAKIEHFLRENFQNLKLQVGAVHDYHSYDDYNSRGIFLRPNQLESLHKPIVNALSDPEKFNEIVQTTLATRPTAEEVFHGRTTYRSERLGLAFDPEFHIEGGYQDGGRLMYVTLYIYSEDKEQLEATRVALDYNNQTKEVSFSIENEDEIANKLGISPIDLYLEAIGGIKEKYAVLVKRDLSGMKRVDSEFDL